MTAHHGSEGAVLVNGFDMTSFLDSVATTWGGAADDATVFQKPHKVYQVGLESGDVSCTGKWKNDTTGLTLDQIDDVFSAALPARVSTNDFIWSPQGDLVGGYAIAFEGSVTDYTITNPVADLIKTSLKVDSCKARDQLAILHGFIGSTETITALGTTVDEGAATQPGGLPSSANGGVAYLQVPTFGGGNLTPKVQHSVDGTTWVDLVTFVTVVSGNTYQRIEVAGTVNRYLRATWSITGPAPVMGFFVGFGRF